MESNELVAAVADEVMRRLEAHPGLMRNVEPDYITLQEVGQRTSFSYDFVYDAVRNGSLPAVKKGREWRVAVADMQAWMNKDRAGHLKPTRSEMANKISQLMPGLSR